jgi:hypothetical protein
MSTDELNDWIDEDNEEVVVDEETEVSVQPEEDEVEVVEPETEDAEPEKPDTDPESETEPETKPEEEQTPADETTSPLTEVLTKESETIPEHSPTMVPVHVVSDLRAKNREANQQIESLRQKLEQQTQPSGERDDVAEQLADDDLVTVAELNRREAARQQRQQQEQANRDEQAFAGRVARTEAEAKTTLTADKCGEGLDYESVTSVGRANLTEGDLLEVRKAADPAKEFYRRCLVNTPLLLKRFANSQTQKPEVENPAPETPEKEEVTQEKILSQDDFFASMFPEAED